MCLSLEVALVRNLQKQYALKEQNMNNPRCNRGYTTTHLGTALKELNKVKRPLSFIHFEDDTLIYFTKSAGEIDGCISVRI